MSTERKTISSLEQRGFIIKPFDIEVNKMNVHGVAFGDSTKKALVFVHGSPGGWTDYSEYLIDSTLLQKFYVICFDRPGFGGSNPGVAMRLPEQANTLALAYEKLNLNNKAVWVGHSLGGPLVVFLAMQRPNVASGLALLAASVSPELEKKEAWRFIFEKPIFEWLLPSKLYVSNCEIKMFKVDVQRLNDPWKTVSTPTLIIHGMKDPLVPFANSDFAMKSLPASVDARKVDIPGANHFIPWNQFEVVRDQLILFFAPKE